MSQEIPQEDQTKSQKKEEISIPESISNSEFKLPESLDENALSSDFSFDKKETEKKSASIVDNLLNQAKSSEKEKLLDETPFFDDVIIDQNFLLAKKFKKLISFTVLLGVLSLMSIGFFHTQLSPSFNYLGANLLQRVQSSNREILQQETELFAMRLVQAQMLLNSLDFEAGKYLEIYTNLQNTNLDQSRRLQLSTELAEMKPEIIKKLNQIKSILALPINTNIVKHGDKNYDYKADLNQNIVDKLRRDSQAFLSAVPPNQLDSKLYLSAASLVAENEIRNIFALANFETSSLDDSQFAQIISSILEKSGTDFAVINSLKSQQINWGQIIADISAITKQSEEGLIIANDSPYNMSLYESGATAAVLFSGFNIDVVNDRISVSGSLRTPTEKTFSLMANIIEKLNASEQFADVNYRAFAKSGSVEKGFESSFSIEFSLNRDLFKKQN
jgi:hypothetical protein